MAENQSILESIRALAIAFLTATAPAALFLPLFGPMLDHHFAERQPGHGHVYFGSAIPDHSHPYEVSRFSRHHVHQAPYENAPVGLRGDVGSYGGIVYLAGYEGNSPGAQILATPTLPQLPLFLDLEPQGFILGPASGDGFLRGALVALPKRPPRI